MKKSSLLFALLLILVATQSTFAQGFQGQATYMSKRTLNDAKISSDKKTAVDDEMDKQFREQLVKAFEKTYILDFNATESSYLKEVALETPQNNSDGMGLKITMPSEDTPLYKNSKTKQYLQEMEAYSGKTNLITDNLPVYEWKIEGETKKIGGYDCYKATATIKVTPKQMADYEAKKLKDSKRKSVMFPAKEPKDEEVVAWFTNDIPVSHGPAKYWGLPGLILELVSGKTTYLCSKIVLNPKEKKPIAIPKKGKVISQADFDAAQKIAYDKMANEDGVIMQTTTTKD